MNTLWRRALASVAAIVGLATLLSACVLSSKENLVGSEETVTPLPASFAFFTYTEKPEGFVRTEEAGQFYALDGKAYVGSDKTMTVHFAPLGTDDTYLMAAVGADGTLYGTARLFDSGVLEIRMVFGEGLEAALEAAAAPPDVAAAITVADGGIEVASRAALDFVIALITENKLPTAPLIAYVAATADSPTPASISRDGDGWKVVN